MKNFTFTKFLIVTNTVILSIIAYITFFFNDIKDLDMNWITEHWNYAVMSFIIGLGGALLFNINKNHILSKTEHLEKDYVDLKLKFLMANEINKIRLKNIYIESFETDRDIKNKMLVNFLEKEKKEVLNYLIHKYKGFNKSEFETALNDIYK